MRRSRINFSYTELSLWESSPRSYWQKYGLGEEGFESPEMVKGKEFMSELQFGISDDPDPILKSVVKRVTTLDIFEERLTGLLPQKYDNATPLVAYLDTSSHGLEAIGEYKTGKIPWTQDMVYDNDQLLFYSMMVYLSTETIPDCFLEWVQTEVNEFGELVYTGNVFHFDVRFTKTQINGMIKRVDKAIREIDEFVYSEHILSDDLVEAYLDLKEKENAIKGKITMIKNEIDNQLFDSGERYGISKHGLFSVVERKDGGKYIKFSKLKNEKI